MREKIIGTTKVPFSRLTPDHEKVCRGFDLAQALSKTTLSASEVKAWNRDLQTAHKTLKAPTDR